MKSVREDVNRMKTNKSQENDSNNAERGTTMRKENIKSMHPMNLQFFADPAGTDPNTTGASSTEPASTEPSAPPKPDEPDTTKPPTVEEQLQQMRIDNAKLKKAMDQAAHEAADYKKQLRTKQTQEEIDNQEKAAQEAARQEEFEALKKSVAVGNLTKNFLTLGYPADLAEKAATAQYENDNETLFQIQSKAMAIVKKQMEAEWIRTRPEAASGSTDDDGTSVTPEQFARMGYQKRVELKLAHPKLYEKLTTH